MSLLSQITASNEREKRECVCVFVVVLMCLFVLESRGRTGSVWGHTWRESDGHTNTKSRTTRSKTQSTKSEYMFTYCVHSYSSHVNTALENMHVQCINNIFAQHVHCHVFCMAVFLWRACELIWMSVSHDWKMSSWSNTAWDTSFRPVCLCSSCADLKRQFSQK